MKYNNGMCHGGSLLEQYSISAAGSLPTRTKVYPDGKQPSLLSML